MKQVELAKRKVLNTLQINDTTKEATLIQTIDSIAQIIGDKLTVQLIENALTNRAIWLKMIEINREILDNMHEFQIELLEENNINAPTLPSLHQFDMASASLQLVNAFDLVVNLKTSETTRKKLKMLLSILITGYLLARIQKDIIKFIALSIIYKLITKKRCYAYVFPESITMDSFVIATNCKDEQLLDTLSFIPFAFYWTKVTSM